MPFSAARSLGSFISAVAEGVSLMAKLTATGACVEVRPSDFARNMPTLDAARKRGL
jgi:hypothetical protein